MRVLVVEPDEATAQVLELQLKARGASYYVAGYGEDAVDLARVYDYDVITLELNLPDVAGLDALRRIRMTGIKTPVLVLTSAVDSIDLRVKAFAAGADDYMAKPFHIDELHARLQAIVRRSSGHASSIVRTGSLEVNLTDKLVTIDGQKVHLTGKEYAVMELLSLRRGVVLTKEMLLNHLYGGMDEPEIKIIDVFICKLRKKLRAKGALGLIETVWGRGYVIREPKAEPKAEPIAA